MKHLKLTLALTLLLTGCPFPHHGPPAHDTPPPPAHPRPDEPRPPEGDPTTRLLETLRGDVPRLRAFFARMPKGGDIHHHLTGAPYAEQLITLAAAQNLCVTPKTTLLSQAQSLSPKVTCAPGKGVPIATATTDSALYGQLLDNWSMRGIEPGTIAAHDHFFNIFPQIDLAVEDLGAIEAELRERAAAEGVSYLETMLQIPEANTAVRALGTELGWNDDLLAMRKRLVEDRRFAPILASANQGIAHIQRRADQLLGCGTGTPSAGCGVTVRYQYYTLRVLPKVQVFADTVLAYEVAASNARVVGTNIVGPEDANTSRVDYALHMQMLGTLRRTHYLQVKSSMHAGELTERLVPPEALHFHIRDALNVGGALRLGHGVDIGHELDSDKTLEEMARRPTAMEILLISNMQLLGVSGPNHPLPMYLAAGVPVVLSTDDPGIMRTSLTEQFVYAATHYPQLQYPDFRKFVRNSLEFSFAEGGSLWRTPGRYDVPVDACADILNDLQTPSTSCRDYLDGSTRARLQLALEQELKRFEGAAARGNK